MNWCASVAWRRWATLSLALAPAALAAPAEPCRQPLVIAHRGASAYAPENTLPAFELALAQGADALEFDVRQSADGVPVLSHDRSVERMTDGSGLVEQLSWAELRALTVDGGAGDKPGRIASLDEVLAPSGGSHYFIVELKDDEARYPGLTARVLRAVRERGLGQRVLLKTFDVAMLARFAELAPELPRLYVYVMEFPRLGFTLDHGLTGGAATGRDARWLQVHRYGLSPAYAERVHRAGYRLVAWDVHEEKTMRTAIAAGVDAIETDDPQTLRRLLAKREGCVSVLW